MMNLLYSIPATVVVACITAIGTYFASKRTSKTTMETLYTTEIQKIIEEYNRQLGELRDEIRKLKQENQDLNVLIQKLQQERRKAQ
ncbi:hypothetical protein MFLO_14362 [Listeria floridensis FSL S10-1187]|uniref:Uncharacterized protein n=1 Tax=Listeria floridensis FSL S10-1187 TaxID=1265817 RepID=A0ABP3AUF7_9LIST|nr:hypothetical protein [Listeria floridensis]EUJ26145.1 hypothetical protein MFLO_14362 [Listeria floridensis FSL S10-1187]